MPIWVGTLMAVRAEDEKACCAVTRDDDLGRLQDELVDLFRVMAGPEQRRKPLLLLAARCLLDARGMFAGDDGAPDWRGRTWAYKTWVSAAYDRADIRENERGAHQAAIRYHLGSLLRDTVPAAVLAGQGFLPERPKDRRVREDRYRTTLAGLVRPGPPLTNTREQLAALTAASIALSRVSGSGLDAAASGEADALLRHLIQEAARLRARLSR